MYRFLLRMLSNSNNSRNYEPSFVVADSFLALIIFLIVLILFFPITFPIIFIFAIVFVIINNKPENKRKNALANAQLYLSPYTNIWNNLKLTNKYCSVELTKNKEIIIRDFKLNYDNTKFIHKIYYMRDDEHWNRLCYEFNYLTNAIDVATQFSMLGYGVETTKETVEVQIVNKNDNANLGMPVLKIDNLEDNSNKTDINNASEIEITALPGISIVLSKKLIQKREEIGGFKTVDEIFEFLKLKPHFETQLRKMICVNKMQGTIRIKKYKERRIDL